MLNLFKIMKFTSKCSQKIKKNLLFGKTYGLRNTPKSTMGPWSMVANVGF